MQALFLLLVLSLPDPVAWRLWPLAETVKRAAIAAEIMDGRESRYMLVRPDDFTSDLRLLRRRFADLHDAPPLADAWRWPDRATISDWLVFNRAYRHHLDGLQPTEFVHLWELRQAINEADHLYQVWDTARDARVDYYYVTVRRGALKQLREELGLVDYAAGRLPPVVPLGRFRRIDP